VISIVKERARDIRRKEDNGQEDRKEKNINLYSSARPGETITGSTVVRIRYSK
jgi:hypothetical protein